MSQHLFIISVMVMLNISLTKIHKVKILSTHLNSIFVNTENSENSKNSKAPNYVRHKRRNKPLIEKQHDTFSSENSIEASTDGDILIDKNEQELINKISTDDTVSIKTTTKNLYFDMKTFISHIPSNRGFFK
jgi:hypothetical protein